MASRALARALQRPGPWAALECRADPSRALGLALAKLARPALMLLLAGPVLAQSGSAGSSISRQSIDGGGGRAQSSSFELTGTIGQADAGPTMTSASFELRGGMHRQPAPQGPRPAQIFADGFE